MPVENSDINVGHYPVYQLDYYRVVEFRADWGEVLAVIQQQVGYFNWVTVSDMMYTYQAIAHVRVRYINEKQVKIPSQLQKSKNP